METRPARNKAEFDYLPAFDVPKVVIVGPAAKLVAAAAATTVLKKMERN